MTLQDILANLIKLQIERLQIEEHHQQRLLAKIKRLEARRRHTKAARTEEQGDEDEEKA